MRGYNNHCFYYYSIRILELFYGIILFCFFILWQHESRHYIAEIFLTLALNTNQPINQSTTWISNERPCLCVSGINFTSGSMIIWFELLNSSNCVIFCFSFYSLTFINFYCLSYCKMQLIVFFKSRIYWPDFQHWIYLINIKMKCNLVWSLQTMFFGFITFFTLKRNGFRRVSCDASNLSTEIKKSE